MNGGVHHNNNNYESPYNRNMSGANQNNSRSGRHNDMVEDLEDSLPGVIPTISNQVSNHVAMSNGHLGGGGKHNQSRAPAQNGHVPNGRTNFRSMLEDAEMDSHI